MMSILEFYNKVHSKKDGKFANTPGPGHAKGAPKATPAQKTALKKVLAKPKTKAGSIVVPSKTAAIKKKTAPSVKKAAPKKAAPEKKAPAKKPAVAPGFLKGLKQGPPPAGVGVAKLSDADVQALNHYVRGPYATINGSLRTGRYRSERKEIRDMIKGIDDAFDKAPVTTEDIVVYRGMNDSQFLKAKRINDPGYISTGYNKDVVESFTRLTGGVGVIKIVIPKGSKVLKVSGTNSSDGGGEGEILLPRDGQFNRQRDGSYRYTPLERDSLFTRQADGSYWFNIKLANA